MMIDGPKIEPSYGLLEYKNVPDAIVKLLRKRVYPEVTGKRPSGSPYPGIDESWSYWEHPSVEPRVMDETYGHVWPKTDFPGTSGGFREPGSLLSFSEQLGDIAGTINPYLQAGQRGIQAAGRAISQMMPETNVMSGKPGQLAMAIADRPWLAGALGLGAISGGAKGYFGSLDWLRDQDSAAYTTPVPSWERASSSATYPDPLREFYDENVMWRPETRPKYAETVQPGRGVKYKELDYGRKLADLPPSRINKATKRKFRGKPPPVDWADFAGASGYATPVPADYEIQNVYRGYMQPDDYQEYLTAREESRNYRINPNTMRLEYRDPNSPVHNDWIPVE
ncbi:MAG: hypothetical protein P8123_09760 [bacterium]